MYGRNNDMYLSKGPKTDRKWSKAKLDARRRKLLNLEPSYKIKDWNVIHINQKDKTFSLQFKIEGSVDEARRDINREIQKIVDDQDRSKNGKETST